MKRLLLALGLAAAVSAAGCLGFERSTTVTGPSNTGISALMGNWASVSAVPSPSSCTDFRWNVTEQTSTSAKGSFTATCPNDLKVAATAQGTLGGSTVNWSANGTATAPNQSSCPIELTGTAELGVDSIRVPYSGSVCSIAVSGVEILRRR